MHEKDPPRAAHHPRLETLLRFFRAGTGISVQVLQLVAWPYLELVGRWWLAKVFLARGLLNLMYFQANLEAARVEYPGRWLSSVAASYAGIWVELGGATLLALGLMTRYAALPLLLVALGLQYAYEPFDSQLFWIALFGWLVIHGAGPISLDHLLRRGLSDSALPLMSPLMHLSGWLRSRGTPLYLTALRIWLACALLVAATLRIGHNTLFIHDTLSSALALWLPLDVAVRLPPYIALSGGVLLLLGAGTRFAAVAAVLALCADSMVDPRSTDAVYLLMVLAILTVHGGGALSFDRLVDWLAGKVFPVPGSRDPRVLAGRPRVVIIGAGFGGISCARALRHTRAAVTLIDRTNYHLFQPLLYQVATAALSPGDIATPARQLFRDAFGTRVLLGTVTGIDPRQHQVVLADQEIAYDYLVLATGATHSYFGKDEWAPHAPGLKSIEDATEIRRRILLAFEEAEATPDEGRRAALLTFLIVGGGPTGVELAGAIAELSRFGMTQDFRAFDPGQARVVLVQSGPRLLPSFPEKLALNAHRALEKLGVELHLNSRVDHIDGAGVAVNGRRIEARTVLWAAGVAASPAARWLNLEPDRAGRIPVGPDLRVPGLANVFAVGDTALSHAWKGAAVPGLAPAAKQGGKYVARQIHAAIHAGPAPAAFRYRHFGSLAAIGRKSAVVDFGRVRVWGAPAWWLWGIVHVGFLLGMRNRVATMVNWFWAYLRFGGGIRLITGVR